MHLERLVHTLTRDGAHLGDILFWSLADARIDRATLEQVWTAAALDPALLPEPPSPEKALKLAVREAQLGQKSRLIRLGKEDEREIVFAVVREDRHEDGGLTYVQEARVRLDRATAVLATDAAAHDVVTALVSAFDTYRNTHPADDVRRSIVKTLRVLAAVPLRPGGGVYYVPAPFAEHLRRLQTAVEQIGSSRVYLLPVHQSPDAASTLGELAKVSIETDLAALKAEIGAFLEAPPDRPSTLIRRFDALEEIRARAALYRTVLAVEVQDLDHQLNQLAGSVEQLLGQKSAA